jgi:hypothetical protein
MEIYYLVAGVSAGSLILGIIIGNVWATQRVYTQMLYQNLQNETNNLWSNLFEDDDDENDERS